MSWLSLFLFLLMCGIIFFQTIHGMFSALIMTTITVLAATVALGLHDQIATDLGVGLIGDYAYPVAFAGLFTVVTVVLRIIADKIISRRVTLPGIIDKGGALCWGIITGLVASGVIGIAVQMIPWGPDILGFRRYDEHGQPGHALWLNPDKFTVKLCGYLADNTLSGGQQPSWRHRHPDFMTELHWLRNTESTGSRIGVGANSVTIKGVYQTRELYDYTAKPTSARGGDGGSFKAVGGPPPDRLWVVVRVSITSDGRDFDGNYRLSYTQVRLVGEQGNHVVQFPLKGIGPYDGRYLTATSRPVWGGKSGDFDFVFEVPGGDDFKYHFLEFKRGGRVDIDPTLLAGELQTNTPTPTAGSGSAAPSDGGGRSGGGATAPVRPRKQDTQFSAALPLAAKRYAGSSVVVGSEGASLGEGSLMLYVDRQDVDGQPRRGGPPTHPQSTELTRFQVPPGLHMLQLNVEAIHAKTLLGGAVNLTRRVLQQYRVMDDRGNTYWPAGLIAECESAGDRIMEVQYFPKEVQFRSQIRPFQQIRFEDLKGDYRLVLLFILPPQTHIVGFDSGGREVDLSDMNLKAPG